MAQRISSGVCKAHRLVAAYAFGMLLSIAIPLLLACSSLRPPEEAIGSWVQRSGAVMVIFALLAEIAAIGLHQHLNPSGYPGEGVNEARKIYRKFPLWMSLFVFLMSMIGSLINSYGDLAFR